MTRVNNAKPGGVWNHLAMKTQRENTGKMKLPAPRAKRLEGGELESACTLKVITGCFDWRKDSPAGEQT